MSSPIYRRNEDNNAASSCGPTRPGSGPGWRTKPVVVGLVGPASAASNSSCGIEARAFQSWICRRDASPVAAMSRSLIPGVTGSPNVGRVFADSWQNLKLIVPGHPHAAGANERHRDGESQPLFRLPAVAAGLPSPRTAASPISSADATPRARMQARRGPRAGRAMRLCGTLLWELARYRRRRR